MLMLIQYKRRACETVNQVQCSITMMCKAVTVLSQHSVSSDLSVFLGTYIVWYVWLDVSGFGCAVVV